VRPGYRMSGALPAPIGFGTPKRLDTFPDARLRGVGVTRRPHTVNRTQSSDGGRLRPALRTAEPNAARTIATGKATDTAMNPR
jgi:hypothetical protein